MRNLFVVATLLLALSASKPGAKDSPDIHAVDFKNFSFSWAGEQGESEAVPSLYRWLSPLPQKRVHITNGLHHFYGQSMDRWERERAPLVSVDSVTYGDLDKDGIEEAAVHLNYSTGGTMNWSFLYIYKLIAGQPKLLAVLESGSRGHGGLVRTAIQDGLLILDFADPNRMAGDCCSEGYIRIRYHWQNGVFAEEGPHEGGDLNLNSR